MVESKAPVDCVFHRKIVKVVVHSQILPAQNFRMGYQRKSALSPYLSFREIFFFLLSGHEPAAYDVILDGPIEKILQIKSQCDVIYETPS